MQKKKIIIVAIIATISTVALSSSIIAQKKVEVKPNSMKKYGIESKSLPKAGVVPDKNTAAKVADVLLNRIYGKSIENNKPFIITYDEVLKAWYVKGRLKPNFIGGVPNILISKENGSILSVWYTK